MRSVAYRGGVSNPVGPLVVMLHGAGLDHTAFHFQTRYLAHHGRRVLAFDLPGHGQNPGPPLTTVEEMASWIAAQLSAEGEAAALIGHSLGGLVALHLAAEAPHLVSSLTLLACSAPMPVNPALQQAASGRKPEAIAMIIGWSYSRPSRLGGHPEPGLWQTGVTASLLRRGLGVLGTDLAATNSYIGGVKAARSITQPTLLVAGLQDRMVPVRAAAELADRIPSAHLETIDAGHMMILEKPEAIRRLLSDFVPSV